MRSQEQSKYAFAKPRLDIIRGTSAINIRRSREQSNFICFAEAQQYMRAKGPNYAETESKENELVRFSLPRCCRICGRRPNIRKKRLIDSCEMRRMPEISGEQAAGGLIELFINWTQARLRKQMYRKKSRE